MTIWLKDYMVPTMNYMPKTSDWVELLPVLELMQFCHSLSFESRLYMCIPHGIQDTPYQQQSVWKTILGHIFPALKRSPVQDDTYHEFHGFSSDSPASHRTPSTQWPWLDELTTEKEHNEHLSTIKYILKCLPNDHFFWTKNWVV